jgi:hypothetical protein
MKRVFCIAVSLLIWPNFATAQSCDVQQSKLAQTAVANLSRVESLPAKKGVPFTDLTAAEILKHGICASPYLVRQLDNKLPSKVVQLFEYKIGQVALQLLSEIHQPAYYPCLDQSCRANVVYGDFHDEVDFFRSPVSRKKLKSSWRSFINKPA